MSLTSYVVDNGYIELPVTTDATTLYNDALTAINAALPGWIPHEGHIDVLLLEQFAQMTAESAAVAALVPQSIFSYFGSLIGINPIVGSAASAFTTWTMIDGNGYTVPAGTLVAYQILGNQVYTFETLDTFTVPGPSPGRTLTSATVTNTSNIITCASANFTSAGDVGRTLTGTDIPTGTTIVSVSSPTTAVMSANATGSPGAETVVLGDLAGQTSTGVGAVEIQATSVGALYNGLVPQNLVLSTALSFVSTIASTTTTAGGEDPETTAAYLNRLSEELQLLTPRPILTNDFAVLAVNTPNADVYRAGAIDLLNPFGNELTTNDYDALPTIGTWAATGATVTSVVGASGKQVVRFTASTTSVSAHTGMYSVAQNTPYYVMCSIDHPSAFTSEAITLGVSFYDVNGAFISNATAPAVAPSTSALTFVPLFFTTPANTFDVEITVAIANSVSTRTYDLTFFCLELAAGGASTPNFVPDSSALAVSSTISWALSGGLTLGPFKTNENSIQYVGTGSASGTLTATGNLFYLAAGTYNLSAYLDASNVTVNAPQCLLKNAAGSTLASLTQPVGAKGTINTTVTLASPTMVNVILSTNNCTVQSGLLLQMAEPQITLGTPVLAYTAGPTSSLPNTSTNQERCVTVVPLTSAGTGLLATQQALVQSYLSGLREVNFEVNVIGPNYVGVDVTWAGVAEDGFNPATVLANANAALTAYLSPASWAGGSESPPIWDLTQTIVRYLSLVTVLGETPGMDYLTSVQIGFHGQSSLGTSDLTMPGYAPLPQAGTINGNVTALPT